LSGASLAHNYLVTSIVSDLEAQLRNRDCVPMSNDLRVFVPAAGVYTYPDVIVLCGKPLPQDAHLDTLLNPTLLVEVLSPSTEAYEPRP
jgi:Uma2 family endonuclease